MFWIIRELEMMMGLVVAIPANGKQGTEMRIGEQTEICMIHVAPLFDLSTTPQLSDQAIIVIIIIIIIFDNISNFRTIRSNNDHHERSALSLQPSLLKTRPLLKSHGLMLLGWTRPI